MLDAWLRDYIDPPLNSLGKFFHNFKVSANSMTIFGFFVGLMAPLMIVVHYFHLAIVFIVLNRLFDGVDGGIARQSKMTDLGGFLDIILDFLFYGLIVLGFALVNPHNALPASFLMFGFLGATTSFLAYAIVATKNDKITTIRGKKSFYHLGGLTEGTETIVTIIICCLFPEHFAKIAYIYGTLCLATTLGRIIQGWQDFKKL